MPTMKETKIRKREEAEQRNSAYQALNLDQKMARNSAKVIRKLTEAAHVAK